jgi:TolA-binding protein
MNRRLPIALALVMMSGCSYLPLIGEDTPPPAPTLADLSPAVLPEESGEVPQLGLQQLAQVYSEVLAVASDDAMRLQVKRRLAEIEMLVSEARYNSDDTGATSFTGAIAAYRSLLQEFPDSPGSDRLLYQLAKAHDLNGEGAEALKLMESLSREFPDSAYTSEAEFRKGESAFARSDYLAAEQSYQRVIATGQDSAYYANALYMQGWSRFKQGHYDGAINAFTATLDQLMRSDNRLDLMAKGDREMAADCLRVLAVIFSYTGGSSAIASTYHSMGERSYQHLVYNALGEHYLKQERYRDSADTYRAYIEDYPQSVNAHRFALSIINAYETGGFPQQVVDEKRRYVQDYAVSGYYWRRVPATERDSIRLGLKQFIEELAQHFHALAQDDRGDVARQHYLDAAHFYRLYIDSFPRDEAVPDMAFLLAEARFASGNYAAAVADYEWMAYRFVDHPKAAEAAYAAILSHQKLASAAEEQQLAYIDSELKFAQVFSADARAPAVLGHAAGQLLQLGWYSRALLAAHELVSWQPAPTMALVLPAWLVIGHSEFELQRYDAAEQAYDASLELMVAGDDRRRPTEERVAASIYRQGEQASAVGRHQLAATHFSRLLDVAPNSSFRVNAQYDAAVSYMKAGDFQAANSLLTDFRQRYPGHALTAGIAATLVANYEAQKNWQAAAHELDSIYRSAENDEVRREALYLSADYYHQGGDTALAIDRYRSYAHEWPQPVAVQLEAMNHLADLYQQQGERDKRYFWLQKMVEAHDGAGQQQSERSLYLAVSSASELADYRYARYEQIQLTVPLKQSLKSKRLAMNKAVAGYEQVNAYGVQQYGTRATFRLALIYQQLSQSLMDSQRPAGLDELALEQYDMLLEEQAYPFEEKAIAIHETNTRRSWEGLYDEWIQQSFTALGQLLPARYGKTETTGSFSREIR